MFLLKAMLREEFRMHAAYSSRRMFLSLPVFVLAVTLVSALALDELQGGGGLEGLVLNLNLAAFLYGLGVGALGIIGKTLIERRQGQQNFLLAMPSLLPLSYRATFLRFFLHDALFYLALLLVPALLGLLIAAPLAHFSLLSVLSAFLALVLSFLYGLALSFAMSVVATRSRAAFAVIVAALLALLLGHGVLHLYGIEAVLPSMGYQLNAPPLGADPASALLYLALTVFLFLALTATAVALVAESYEGKGSRAGELLPAYFRRLAFSRSLQPFLAKELVDLRRSGGLGRTVFSFVVPLAVLSFTTWYVNHGLDVPVGFNLVFYGAMVGLFGVALYSSLTNVDAGDYYQTLPVDVPRVIRAKLIIFLLLTLGISTAFMLGIALLNGETRMLWLALPVMYVTSVYTVVATSYLTGLNPNSALFSPEVLTKFLVVSILPTLGLTVLSFSVERSAEATAVGVVGVLTVLVVSALLFYRGLDTKWAGRGFN